jgi:carboxyl-terminal processing protease
MKKLVLKIVICIVAAILIFAGGVWAGAGLGYLKEHLSALQSNIFGEGFNKIIPASISQDTADRPDIKKIEEALNLISGNSLAAVSDEELVQGALKGIISVIDDRYAEYFTAEEYKLIMESYSGTTSGIGVVVTLDEEERVVVVRVLEDAPASKTDITEGDIITGVNDTDIIDMDLEKVVAMIKGEEGTDVSLKIYRPSIDKTFDVTVTRAKFDIPNLISEIFEEEIGYIWYYDFQISGVRQLDREIQKLITSGARGLILDLRNNPGGAWDDAVEVCDLFLDEGKIVSIRGRSNNKERVDEYSAVEGKYTEIPLIVLINEFSASASELVAGALKDNDRAVLIGEKSYGKGAVQVLYELSDSSGIKFTTAKYFLPSGISVEGTGVSPDIIIELKPEDEEDLQLNRAIEEMKALIGEIE